MDEARRAVPGRTDVPLHVAVVGEEFAVRIERQVVVVAEAAREDARRAGGRVDAQHGAARRHDSHRVAARVPHAFADEVLGPRRACASIHAGWHRGVVAEGDVDGAVGARHHAVRAVLAAVVLPFEDALLLVVGAVAVRVAQAPESGRRAGG